MSKECIPYCPNIQSAIENYPEGATPSVATQELLAACAATYLCEGPQPTDTEVVIGYFRKRTELQPGFVCGLE